MFIVYRFLSKYFSYIYDSVNASQAGEGNFDVVITTGSENVPLALKSLGSGNFDLSFTPQRADLHLVMIKFNGEMIPGKHFTNQMLL